MQMTPLIDVVFLLLTFFLVATKLSEEDQEIDVKLPVANAATPLRDERDELFLNLDAEGTCFVEGEKVGPGGLVARLGQRVREVPGTRTVVLRADRNCDWNHVVSAIDACHAAGLHDVRPTVKGD